MVLGAVGYGLRLVISPDGITGSLVFELMWANLWVGGFNLLPGLPLDGGRMLRGHLEDHGPPGDSDDRRRLGGPDNRGGLDTDHLAGVP